MTQRLPRTLKKKLEASLENLTPRQAGKLWLLYSHEHDKQKTRSSFWDYPPVVELMQAWERRVEETKGKKDDSNSQIITLYNGFITLTDIILEANRWSESSLWRLSVLAMEGGNRINNLILQDFQSEIARMTIGHFTEDIPRPLSWDNYNQAVEWYDRTAPVELGELANTLIGEWVEQQGYTDLLVPREFLEAKEKPTTGLDQAKQELAYREAQTEELRRQWVEAEGEAKIAKQHFAGDRDRLEAWLKYGGCPEFNESEWGARADELFDHLVEMVKSGELAGGLCFGLIDLWGVIPSPDWKEALDLKGRIPAWAALRSIWDGWLYDQGIFKSDELIFVAELPDPFEKFYDVEGTLTGDRLAATAKKFYQDCRKKPWGAGLADPKKIDFTALGFFLCLSESPLLGYYAPDLGWVEVETFGKSEGTDVFLGREEDRGRPDWYATSKSLREKAGDLGFKPDSMGYNFIREYYYPTDRPEEKRRSIARLFRQLDTLRVSHRPFTYREKNKRDLPSFLGLEFYTPLEEAVKDLGTYFGGVKTFKMTYDLLSQEFFDGIPVLRLDLQEHLKNIDEMLDVAENRLNQWLKILSSEVWNIDTSSLRLVKADPDERQAKELAAIIIRIAEREATQDRNPAGLENGETLEQVTKRLTGLDYKGLKLSLTGGK